MSNPYVPDPSVVGLFEFFARRVAVTPHGVFPPAKPEFKGWPRAGTDQFVRIV